MKSKILLLIAAVGLVHCSMPDDVEETKNTSKALGRELAKVSELTEEFVYKGGKQLTNKDVRDIYNYLINAETHADRVLYATWFYSTFEFQQWHGLYNSDDKLKDELNEKGLRIVFAVVDAFTNRNFGVGGRMPVTAHWTAAGALGIAMSEIDADQIKAAKRRSIGAVSVYDLILSGLKYKGAQARGEKIPSYARMVLANEEEAVFLLQMRHNFFPAMMLSEFSDLDKTIFSMSNFGNIPSDLVNEVKNVFHGPKIRVHEATLEKIAEKGIGWLKSATETQDRLQELGYPLKFNKFVGRLFVLSKIDYESATDKTLFQTAPMVQLVKAVDRLKLSYINGGAGPIFSKAKLPQANSVD